MYMFCSVQENGMYMCVASLTMCVCALLCLELLRSCCASNNSFKKIGEASTDTCKENVNRRLTALKARCQSTQRDCQTY